MIREIAQPGAEYHRHVGAAAAVATQPLGGLGRAIEVPDP